MQFHIPGHNVVYDVSLDRDIGSITQHAMTQMASYRWKLNQTHGLAARSVNSKVITPLRASLSSLRFVSSWQDSFLRLLWVLVHIQTVKFFNFIGDEDNIRNEHFKLSWASTFSYNKNAISLTVTVAHAAADKHFVYPLASPHLVRKLLLRIIV